MALQMSLQTTSFGMPAPQAYVVINDYRGDKNIIIATILTFYNQEAKQNGNDVINSKIEYIQSHNLSGDILPALYNYLKTLPEYEGATDC